MLVDLFDIACGEFCNFGIKAECFAAQFKLVIRDLFIFFPWFLIILDFF